MKSCLLITCFGDVDGVALGLVALQGSQTHSVQPNRIRFSGDILIRGIAGGPSSGTFI